jgi:DNA polymerase-3 subunit epsilon
MQFVAFDIETTGFLPRVDQIVEIAGARFKDGKLIETFKSLVDPKVSIPANASRVHGITDAMVLGQPLVEEVLAKFAEFCKADVLVAHNAPFDTEFIKADVAKHETPAPTGIILDTCAMARKVIPGSANYKLGTLVAHLKIPSAGNFHRAEADSIFCGSLFAIMLERIFKSDSPVVIENLVNLSGGQVHKFPQISKSFRQLDFLSLI